MNTPADGRTITIHTQLGHSLKRTRLAGKSVLILLVYCLTACASMRTVDVQNAMRHPPPPGVDVGSLVQVGTLDDRKLEFRVTDIGNLGLDGKYGFVAYENMAWLKVENPDKTAGNTMSYILGALGIAALVALINNADSVHVCSNTPCNEP